MCFASCLSFIVSPVLTCIETPLNLEEINKTNIRQIISLSTFSAVTGSIPLQSMASKASAQAIGHEKNYNGIVQEANLASERTDQVQDKIASSTLYTARGINDAPTVVGARITGGS